MYLIGGTWVGPRGSGSSRGYVEASCIKSSNGMVALYKNGALTGSVPMDAFLANKSQFLASLASGTEFTQEDIARLLIDGHSLTPQQATEKRRTLLAGGRDLTLRVPRHTRELVEEEAGKLGQFSTMVDSVSSELWPNFARELFAKLYSDPKPLRADEVHKNYGDWAQKLHEAAEESGEFDILRTLSQNDEWAAGIGAASIGRKLTEAFGEELKNLPAEDPEKLERTSEALKEIEGAEELAEKLEEKKEENVRDLDIVAGRIGNKFAKAVAAIDVGAREASNEVVGMDLALSALGCGGSPGALSKVTGPREEILNRLRSDPHLRKVAEIAGRLKVVARAAQKAKTRYVPEQITDVTIGGEVSRLLPSELSMLAFEETELLELKRILERDALQYELTGSERVKCGPLVLCVDESGSMHGAKHQLAMGFALALMEICVIQKRAFAIVHFDDLTRREWICRNPQAVKASDLFDEVSYFSGGNTNFEAPLATAVNIITSERAYEKSDVILLTDGAASWKSSDGAMERLRHEKASVWGVEIGGQFTAAQKSELAGVVSVPHDLIGGEKSLEVALAI